ncbi:2Fe-2S iron-sulfur cluster-binding protein [Nocardia sp. R6R-6]|uniref:2Fe-2S iron-sulfur cluster-binding protein n=1 Tax=Nocardia sp. R6R-6 TaxID=3459303 RepID=UPI00403D5601
MPGASELVVRERRSIAEGVVCLDLARPDGNRLPDWTAGSHIDLVLPNGVVRQYSLCGDRWDAHSYRIAVLREPDGRGGSAYVHDRLRVGDHVGVGGPRNNFHVVPATKYYFIAGGIGITPLFAMIREAERAGAEWSLLYGGRTRSSMAFVDELSSYGDRVTIAPQDECGLLDLAGYLSKLADGDKVYCCGPAPLLDAVAGLTEVIPPNALRIERFAAGEIAPAVRDEPFDVELARSGFAVTVDPRTSVLEAIAAAGVSVLTSCRMGVCGTCETTVLSGEPDHRDSILDDVERRAGDSMYVCVSRSIGDRLVLDL